jgi:hypothetical protein
LRDRNRFASIDFYHRQQEARRQVKARQSVRYQKVKQNSLDKYLRMEDISRDFAVDNHNQQLMKKRGKSQNEITWKKTLGIAKQRFFSSQLSFLERPPD